MRKIFPKKQKMIKMKLLKKNNQNNQKNKEIKINIFLKKLEEEINKLFSFLRPFSNINFPTKKSKEEKTKKKKKETNNNNFLENQIKLIYEKIDKKKN